MKRESKYFLLLLFVSKCEKDRTEEMYILSLTLNPHFSFVRYIFDEETTLISDLYHKIPSQSGYPTCNHSQEVVVAVAQQPMSN